MKMRNVSILLMMSVALAIPVSADFKTPRSNKGLYERFHVENDCGKMEEKPVDEKPVDEKPKEETECNENETKDDDLVDDDTFYDFRYVESGWSDRELADAYDAAYEGHSRLELGLEG